MRKLISFCVRLGLLSILLTIISCNKEDDAAKINSSLLKDNILQEKALLGSDLSLPKGTIWNYSNSKHTEVHFKLPEGYTFLLKSNITNAYFISDEGGGYSCTCSGGGSCTTFYNSELGYGCLHSDCTGSCTGKNAGLETNSVIVGVLNLENSTIDSNLSFEKASLTQEGKLGFFEVPEVKDEIKKTYDFVYKHSKKPHFEELFINKKNNLNYQMVKTMLYGVELALVIPNEESVKSLFPKLKLMSLEEAGKSCSCSGGSTGGSCEIESKGAFGYKVYYCNGCTTCTMN